MDRGDAKPSSPFRQSLHLRAATPALWYTILILLAVELLVSLLGPAIVPERVYLSAYLGERARESTIRFLEDRDDHLVYDSLLGWRNRPNVNRGNWQLDANGARTTHAYGMQRTTPTRVLFVGSSLINGGTGVTGDETISAYLEDATIESLNFGTMLYALDQMYLAYASGLWRHDANVLVVGLAPSPSEGLGNRYVPLHYPEEVYMPYFKPRFVLNDTTINLVPVPERGLWRTIFAQNALVDSLKTTDEYYGEFAAYQRCGFSPVAASGRTAFKEARELIGRLSGRRGASPLVLTLMRRLEAEAVTHGARVVFLLIPDQTTAFPSGWRARMPDQFGALVATLRGRGFTVLDVRQILRDSGESPGTLYFEDGIHFRPIGNRHIAAALRPLVTSRSQ